MRSVDGELSTAARLLKQRTAESHRRVEHHLGLLDTTPERLLAALVRLSGFWAAYEPAVDDWFAAHPHASRRLQWQRRARLALLLADVDVLAGACDVETPALVTAPAVGEVDEAAVYGWLYVAEGSTLGGAVIDHALRNAGFAHRLSSFTPYPEGPAPMWRSFLRQLDSATAGDAARVERVVAAGAAIFAALEDWVTPASERVPR